MCCGRAPSSDGRTARRVGSVCRFLGQRSKLFIGNRRPRTLLGGQLGNELLGLNEVGPPHHQPRPANSCVDRRLRTEHRSRYARAAQLCCDQLGFDGAQRRQLDDVVAREKRSGRLLLQGYSPESRPTLRVDSMSVW
jgi:hypothetical protein